MKSLFIILCILSLSVACTDEDDAWNRIEKSGVIRVGLDPTYPPFEWVEEDQLKGIDVDLANALADDLGLRAEFRFFGYDGLYDALFTDQVDMLVSGMVILPEQTRDFSYSDSYYDAGQVLISRSTNRIKDLGSVDGGSLAVELGAEGHVVAKERQRRSADLIIVPFKSSAEALEAVISREADAALVDSVTGRLFLSSTSGLEISDRPVTSEPFALVVRREDSQLLDHLNEGLGILGENGVLAEIVRQWLNQHEFQ